jgi:hypothetical protein
MNLSVCAPSIKLAASERKVMAIRALAGAEPISALASRHGVSHPPVYRQMHKASVALDELFSPVQTDDAAEYCSRCQSPNDLVRATCLLHRKPENSVTFWQAWNRLHAAIGRPFYAVYAAVSQAMKSTPRSSSLVENLNSRIRNCLTLRRHLNGSCAWLGPLQFFFNHRRFIRGRCSGRVGKSPREVMTGHGHPHWLTLLGLGPLQPQGI